MCLTICRFFIFRRMLKGRIQPNIFYHFVRSQDQDNVASLQSALASANWDDLAFLPIVVMHYTIFVEKFMKMYNNTLPVTVKKTRCNFQHHKPWVFPAILKSIHRKHSHRKKKYIIKRSEVSKIKYVHYKNKLPLLFC